MLGVPLLRLTAVAGLLLVVATPALCVSLKDYAGQYVLRLGDKNFLVLRLEESHGKLGGTLSRPLHASLGSSFSKIGAAVLTERITSARVIADHLHIQATNPQDPSDSDDYELTLQSAITASLQLYAFFSNKNDDPALLMEAAVWWIQSHQLDHFEKAIKIKKMVEAMA